MIVGKVFIVDKTENMSWGIMEIQSREKEADWMWPGLKKHQKEKKKSKEE